ncbi:MAG: nucleoside 2-deoxyribosyltransferase [Lachnospirales bacterium]
MNDKSDSSKAVTSLDIFKADTDKLSESDILIANLDGGLEIDSGVACEIGYFNALCQNDSSKKIIGLVSDVRWNASNGAVGEQHGVYKNLYVIGAIKDKGILVENKSEANFDFSNEILKVLKNIL